VTASKTKILGQEPAAILAVVRALLTMLLSFGLFSLTTEMTGVILAAVSALLGLVEAYATRTTLYSAAVAAGQSVLILAVTFGLNLTDEQQGAVLAVLAIVAGLYLRDKTSSTETAISSESPGTAVAESLANSGQTPVPVVEVSTSP
jgi:hypothetical protein